MDIKGNWQAEKILNGFDDNFNIIYITKEELDKQKLTQKNKEAKMFSHCFLKIDDENIRMYLKFDSEAELNKYLKANSDEKPVIEDGMIFLEEIKIIKKDGGLFFSSGYDSVNEREMLEPLLIEDGLLNVMFTLYKRA